MFVVLSFVKALERKGNLRHIRISNQGDFVAVFPLGFGYTQTGIHVHLKNSQEMQVGHRNLKRSFLQVRLPGTMKTAHELAEHKRRLMLSNNTDILKNNTVEDFYLKHFGKEQ